MRLQLLLSTVFLSLFMNQAAVAEGALASGELEGAFSSWGKSSLSGNWSVVEDQGKLYIELADNFKAKKGPDVKVFLSPTASDKVTGKNAVSGSVFVQLLDDFDGSNRIALPEGVTLDDYQSLVFHCEEYSKLWGVSSLR